MKQQDLTVVAVRFPDDVLAELDVAAKYLRRKRGPTALELIKVGLDHYRSGTKPEHVLIEKLEQRMSELEGIIRDKLS